jgi:hypothetical protein
MVCNDSLLHLRGECQVWSGRLRSINVRKSAAHILLEECFCRQHFVLFDHVTLYRRGFRRSFNYLHFVYFIISFTEELLNSLLGILI